MFAIPVKPSRELPWIKIQALMSSLCPSSPLSPYPTDPEIPQSSPQRHKVQLLSDRESLKNTLEYMKDLEFLLSAAFKPWPSPSDWFVYNRSSESGVTSSCLSITRELIRNKILELHPRNSSIGHQKSILISPPGDLDVL